MAKVIKKSIDKNSGLFSLGQLEAVTGKSARTIRKRLAGLPPISKTGRGHLYESRLAFPMIYEPDFAGKTQAPESAGGYNSDYDKNRLQAAKATRAEIDLAKIRGELVEIDSVVKEVEKEYIYVRAAFLSIPTKLAKSLSVMDDPAEIQEELESAINESLSHLQKDKD